MTKLLGAISCVICMGLLIAGCEAGVTQGAQTPTRIQTITAAQIAGDENTTSSDASPATQTASDANFISDSNTTSTSTPEQKTGPQVAIYWGTGDSQGKDPNFATVCATAQYDIIILSFAYSIGSNTRNLDGYPEMSISGCGAAYNSRNPYLPNCSTMGAIIPTCQAAGKKVILSLGGGGASVGFNSDAEAAAYATLIWDMALGGNGNVRPFGNAVLDGIDLDIESGSATGYGAFVSSLRSLMDADPNKPYIITAAPQCIFPDEWMGPGAGTALTIAPNAFDHLFVQFYNNDCRWANASAFATTYNQWSTLSTTHQPKIWIGLPGSTDAAMVEDFVPVSGLPALVKAGSALSSYGGVMLWDAGYDIIDAAAGAAPYSLGVAQAQNALVATP